MQRLGQYLLTNNLRMCIAVLACMLIPYFPFGIFAAILVALVTLQRGALVGLGVLAWALLPSIATNIKFAQMADLAMQYDGAFLLSLVAWFLACSLRYFRNWSRVLETAGFAAVVVMVLFLLIPTGITAPLMLAFKAHLIESVSHMLQVDANMLAPVKQIQDVQLAGWMFASVVFSALISIVIARVWHLAIIAPDKQRGELYHVRMGKVAATIAAAVIVAALATRAGFLVGLLPVAFILLAFAGFSVVRYVVATKVKSTMAIAATFVITFLMVLFLLQFAVIVLTLLCIADSWIDLRRLKILA